MIIGQNQYMISSTFTSSTHFNINFNICHLGQYTVLFPSLWHKFMLCCALCIFIVFLCVLTLDVYCYKQGIRRFISFVKAFVLLLRGVISVFLLFVKNTRTLLSVIHTFSPGFYGICSWTLVGFRGSELFLTSHIHTGHPWTSCSICLLCYKMLFQYWWKSIMK